MKLSDYRRYLIGLARRHHPDFFRIAHRSGHFLEALSYIPPNRPSPKPLQRLIVWQTSHSLPATTTLSRKGGNWLNDQIGREMERDFIRSLCELKLLAQLGSYAVEQMAKSLPHPSLAWIIDVGNDLNTKTADTYNLFTEKHTNIYCYGFAGSTLKKHALLLPYDKDRIKAISTEVQPKVEEQLMTNYPYGTNSRTQNRQAQRQPGYRGATNDNRAKARPLA